MEQLEKLQRGIESKLKQGAEGLDIGYWESLLSQLKAHSARGRLRDKHQEKLRDKLRALKAEQLEKAGGEEYGGLDPRDDVMAKASSSAKTGQAKDRCVDILL